MRFHRLTWLLLFIYTAPGIGADLAKPGCTAVARWATDFELGATYQVAPRVSLPKSADDEQMVALFGKPVTEWTKKDFRDFNQQLGVCQKALFKTDREAARRINVARKGFRGTAGAVRNLTLSAQRTREAVDTLLALPATNENLQILALAQSALNGEDIAGRLKTSPRGTRRPLSQIKQSYAKLASVQAEALVQRLSERSQEIQASLDAQETAEAEAREQEKQRIALEKARMLERAVAEMKAAREELGALPVTTGSLAALDRLEQTAALEQVPPAEAEAFRKELAAKRQAVEAEVEREHTQRMASELDERLQRLRSFEMQKLADLGVFWQMVVDFANPAKDPGNADALATVGYDSDEMQAFSRKFDDSATAMLPDFEQYLQAIPATAAGMQRVKTAVADATGVRMRSVALQPYYVAAQQRAQAIDAAMRHAAEWFSVEPRLQALLQGEEVDDASIRGLRSGMDQAKAVAQVKQQWGFESNPGLSPDKNYTPKRSAWARLKQERRDGGELTLHPTNKRLGQVVFTEHYLAKLDFQATRDWTVQRFGKPDMEIPSASGISLIWRDGDQRLQVRASNQVEVMRRGAGYRSQLALALWNDDYENYLDEANDRCDKIRKLPRSEMSIDQSMFFVSNCPLAAGHRIEPGL